MQERDVNIFVHLGYGFGGRSWAQRHKLGMIPGLNDRLAYGYYRAAGNGWSIEYSEDRKERALVRLCRVALRKMMGCDLVHAWRNREGLLASDVVWTHTEIENLAVLLLFSLYRLRRRPKVIANCVWLFDRWSSLSWLRRSIYRRLLKQADIISTFSSANRQVARNLLPTVRCEYVKWGAAVDELKKPGKKSVHSPLRIASLGNDIHRDWETLIRAFGNRKDYEIAIGSRRVSPKLLAGMDNVRISTVTTADDVKALYEWADLVVVSVKPNLHASGITVVLESAILGVPVVCTDSGGLRDYFSTDDICYVPPHSPSDMRMAVERLAQDDERRWAMTIRAQKRLLSADLTAKGFAERHRQLSEELLGQERGGGSCEDVVRA